MVATFLTLDLYFTNSFLCHCTHIQILHLCRECLHLKKKKVLVGLFTALLRPCYGEMKVISVRKRGCFSFAPHHFPHNSDSLPDDGWQLLDSLCSPAVGCRGIWERQFWKLALGKRLSFICSAAFLEKETKSVPNLLDDGGLPCESTDLGSFGVKLCSNRASVFSQRRWVSCICSYKHFCWLMTVYTSLPALRRSFS